MRHGSSLLSVVVVTMVGALGLSACGDRASGETHAAAKHSAPSSCPSVEQVSQAAGFPLKFTQSIGSSPDTWMACQYEMTGRYRGTFVMVTGEPASRADSVFSDIKGAAKVINGQNAEADRIDVGTGGWGYGSGGKSEAAAVVGGHVYHAEIDHMGLGDIGDQKDAMVRVLKLVAR